MTIESIFSSVTELATAIRGRRVSAAEVLDAHLTQIQTHNPVLNAIVTLDVEGARKRAFDADEALARGELWGPLHGVPFTLKDAHSTAGVRTTTGFPALDHVPSQDGTIAMRLKAAGGILMGKTNVATMLADPAQTSNPIFGRTNNPWNLGYTPGGSSGGAAAAVATGLTPFDIGTDLAGPIRIPAHFCGVFGLKPTEQRVSLDGLIPGLTGPRSVRIMSCIGPIARSVDDLSLLYSIIAGADGCDTEVKPVPLDPVPKLPLTQLRVAVAPTFPGVPVATGIRQVITELAVRLERTGAIVEDAKLPAVDFRQMLSNAGELIGMCVGAFQPDEQAQPTTLAQYLTALDQRDKSILEWEHFLATWDVLLCPAAAVTAFPHCTTGAPLQLDEEEMAYWTVNAHTTVFNYTGHLAIVLPYKHDHDGPPIGVQLVGKRWGEARLLAVARALSDVTGPFTRPPGY